MRSSLTYKREGGGQREGGGLSWHEHRPVDVCEAQGQTLSSLMGPVCFLISRLAHGTAAPRFMSCPQGTAKGQGVTSNPMQKFNLAR